MEQAESGGPGRGLMENRELRALARAKLDGKWGRAVVVAVMFLCLVNLPAFMGMWLAGAGPLFRIVGMLVGTVLNYGLYSFFLRIVRGEHPPVRVLFDGFRMFWKVVGLQLWTYLLVLPWVLLVALPGTVAVMVGMVTSLSVYRNPWPYWTAVGLAAAVVGIVVGLRYALILGLLNDHPDWSVFQIARTSAETMRNRRWKYFLLQLSFVGWAILSLVTLGLGSLFLIPYVTATKAAFYEDLRTFGDTTPTSPPAGPAILPEG